MKRLIYNLYIRFVKRFGGNGDQNYLSYDEYVINKQMLTNRVENEFNCYEIHTVQSRMYGCDEQCDECRDEEVLKL